MERLDQKVDKYNATLTKSQTKHRVRRFLASKASKIKEKVFSIGNYIEQVKENNLWEKEQELAFKKYIDLHDDSKVGKSDIAYGSDEIITRTVYTRFGPIIETTDHKSNISYEGYYPDNATKQFHYARVNQFTIGNKNAFGFRYTGVVRDKHGRFKKVESSDPVNETFRDMRNWFITTCKYSTYLDEKSLED